MNTKTVAELRASGEIDEEPDEAAIIVGGKADVVDFHSTTAIEDGPTQHQLLLAVAESYKRRGHEVFASLHQVEFHLSHVVDAFTVEQNPVLNPAFEALQVAGFAVEPNVGSIKRILGLTQADIDTLFCVCNNGPQVSSSILARRIEEFANRPLGGSWDAN
ncbi:hypothetical protein COW86_02650 [Candidatus Kuenenbacteria bacterium CG22_combo_CG10-13_8_21_14_all_39_9]|uniref:Uncharacterized protein n=1 Tax=Candidatus Kuenenbacteria bacterium CG22_combo_CG10-13_8_21_14_all_39_9 TaxID=1974621 RepID=A0A2H0D0G4_9BACT|nr:MAG: hypothetical protein COW86_02650 [Candidatus Kuenenbacteria bacterium CG22_combo_CG10-13_8_21_14_all_39_9]